MTDIEDPRRDSVRQRGRRIGVRALTGVMALTGLVGLPASSSPSPSSPDASLRILITGDSMTQGSAGDWTWRYRLWKDLQASGTDVDFVGPSTDMCDVTTSTFGSHDYPDPDFDQDHAARWGLSLAFPDEHRSIKELVTDYQPDVVVEMLGVNDLTWLQGSPQNLIDALREWVAAGRTVDPDVDFVLGRIPQPWLEKVATFNDDLEGLADELTTADSKVVIAESDADISRATDSWDTFHPNARGEIKIAAGMADALAELGVGQPVPRPLPIAQTVVGPRFPAVPDPPATALRSLHLIWTRSPGAPETDVYARDVTAGEPWHRVGPRTQATDATLDGLPAWHWFELKLLPVKGQVAADDMFSVVVSAEVPGDALEGPTPTASALADGTARVAWPPVLGASAYTVQWRPVGSEAWALTDEAVATSYAVSGLTGRASVEFRVRATRGGLVGDWSAPVGAYVPPLPAVGRVAVSRTAHGFRTEARPVPGADGYTLRVAPVTACVRTPAARRFTVAVAGLARPVRRVAARAPAVWVRWTASLGGVEGAVARSSSRCITLRR